MGRLIYITNVSLDGCIEDASGSLDWSDARGVHEYITDLVRSVDVHVYGRRLYQTMCYWEAPVDTFPADQQAFARVWQQARKVVVSRTLREASSRATCIVPQFDPDAIAQLKAGRSGDLLIGGANLASQALDAGLVDECHLFLHPVLIGRGKPAFDVSSRRHFELIGTRHFDSGAVHVHARVRNMSP